MLLKAISDVLNWFNWSKGFCNTL